MYLINNYIPKSLYFVFTIGYLIIFSSFKNNFTYKLDDDLNIPSTYVDMVQKFLVPTKNKNM